MKQKGESEPSPRGLERSYGHFLILMDPSMFTALQQNSSHFPTHTGHPVVCRQITIGKAGGKPTKEL